MLVTKKFYVDRGLVVTKSFGRKYVEFESEPGHPVLALYPRKAAAKDAGVAPEGSGSHRLVLISAAGDFTDPDGYTWESGTLPDGVQAPPPADDGPYPSTVRTHPVS